MRKFNLSLRLACCILVGLGLLTASCKTSENTACIYDPVNSNVRNFPDLKHNKVSGIDIADGMFRGLLEYLPKGYNADDTTKKYPLIIYFHGREARGEGTKTDLCRILWDGITGTGSSLPPLIEGNEFPDYTDHEGEKYQFIVISPQFTDYLYPKKYPSVTEVDAVIDYLVKNYNVDSKRVYLTGMSTGANMVVEYAASKQSRGKVAAISTASLCDSVSISTNVDRDLTPENIASNKTGVWFMQCRQDDRCSVDIPIEWYERIRKAGGNAKITILDNKADDPKLHCARFEHNTWYRMYDPAFRIDGLNLYEWFLQYRSE